MGEQEMLFELGNHAMNNATFICFGEEYGTKFDGGHVILGRV